MTGLADSPFFAPPPNNPNKLSPIPAPVTANVVTQLPTKKVSNKEKAPSVVNTHTSHHDTTTPRNHDTVVSSNNDAMVKIVRKAVKEFGKEAATHRFTVEEKRGVLDLIYTYKGSGIKTSENEVARIAINYILEDYKQNGRNSILDKVLKALNE